VSAFRLSFIALLRTEERKKERCTHALGESETDI
jgi:hypothetical protein